MSLAPLPKTTTELSEVWQQLSLNRKVGLVVLAVATLTGLVFFINWAQTPDYAVVFSELPVEDGAAIVTYLKENNIPYELGNGGSTIQVPADQVHEIRLALASQGLPSEGAVGMELFDTTSLGMTDFVQQVNYQRAIEGELARTINSLNSVRSARIHIVIPQPTLFSDDEAPTTASIVLELAPGQRLSPEQVQAISHLVSSAVEGLVPQNLTIVDMNGNVLADGGMSDQTTTLDLTTNQIEVQRSLEQDLERRISTMLENVLGPDKAVVRVTSDMNWDQVESENERLFPGEDDGVLRSSRYITETVLGDTNAVGGVPGTASNITDAAASFQTAITDTNGSAYQRVDLTNNYEVSRLTSRTISASGQINRLSVSVLVDNITDTVTIAAIEQATIAAAGINAQRGDVISINSIVFDRTAQTEQALALETAQQREFYLQLAQWGAVGIALVALFFVVRSMQRSLNPAQQLLTAEADAVEPQAALLNEVSQAIERDEDFDPDDLDSLGQIRPPTFDSKQKAGAEKAQMLRQLQIMAKNKPETVAQIIQFWLMEDEKAS